MHTRSSRAGREGRWMTITELARRLNLSTCTVSKIMNRSFTGVTYASATIRRVEAAALKLGYVPNAHAQSLRTKRSMTIDVVVPAVHKSTVGLAEANAQGWKWQPSGGFVLQFWKD